MDFRLLRKYHLNSNQYIQKNAVLSAFSSQVFGVTIRQNN